jgi:hypothetical protein
MSARNSRPGHWGDPDHDKSPAQAAAREGLGAPSARVPRPARAQTVSGTPSRERLAQKEPERPKTPAPDPHDDFDERITTEIIPAAPRRDPSVFEPDAQDDTKRARSETTERHLLRKLAIGAPEPPRDASVRRWALFEAALRLGFAIAIAAAVILAANRC